MVRAVMLAVCTMVFALALDAQVVDSTMAFTTSSSISVPYSKKQVMDHALQAWRGSFGLEPGAKILSTDPDQGVIHAIGHFNFRSKVLTGREETMGRVTYMVRIEPRNGECRTIITRFHHNGNSAALRGGIDLGMLTVSGPPTVRTGTMSRRSATKVLDEIRGQAREVSTRIIRNFEAHMRSSAAKE